MTARANANRAVIERMYALMNERRFDEMWELFAPDAIWSGGSGPGRTVEEMRRIIVDPNPRFEDGGIEFVLHATTAEDDRVAAEAESRATLTDGRRYNNHYHMLFVFSDGRIQRVKEYNDTLHAHETFGGS